MPPSADCATNLFCSEDVFEGLTDDDNGSFCEEDRPEDSRKTLLPADPVDDQAAFSVFLEKEIFHFPEANYLQKFRDKILDANLRQRAVSWLLEVRAFYNFGALTAALSVNYLDRFLSRHQLPNGKAWTLQLLSVACLSLAAKMEETDVPLLLDLQVGSDYVFEPRTMQRMELLVLSTLEWRMSSVTPFSFVDYFIRRFDLSDSTQLVILHRTNEFILCALQELRFLEYRPSSIAAAAALCAIQEMFPVQLSDYKKIILSVLPPLEDSLERCFLSMLELFGLATRIRNDSSGNSLPQTPVGVLDAAFSSDSESRIRSIESRPSVDVSSPVSKKRKVDCFF